MISTSNSKRTLGFLYSIKKAWANSTRPNYGLSKVCVSPAICSFPFPHIFDVTRNTTRVCELLKKRRWQRCPVGFGEPEEWIWYWQAEMLQSILRLRPTEIWHSYLRFTDSLTCPSLQLLIMDAAKILLTSSQNRGHWDMVALLSHPWCHVTLPLLADLGDPWGSFFYYVFWYQYYPLKLYDFVKSILLVSSIQI